MANIANPIKYSSRTFQSILNDINSDAVLVNKPNWFKRIWAGIGDVLSIWLNSMVNLMFLRTSYTRQSVADLLQLIDYYMASQTASSGIVLFYVDTSLGSAIYPFTLGNADLKAKSQGSLLSSSKNFQSDNALTFSLVSQDLTTTDFNISTGIVTSAYDYQYTGHKIQFATSGTLPAPLSVATDYYVVYLNATQIRLATSLANALAGNYITFLDVGTGTFTATLYSKQATLSQQEFVSAPATIGVSDGSTPWQEFEFPDLNVLPDSVSITINSVAWIKVATFVDSTSTSKNYKLYQKSNGRLAIIFGDGNYGLIPPAFDIISNYAKGGGSNSNLFGLNQISIYAGASSKIKGVTNVSNFTGGNDSETIVSAKRIAPLLLKSRDRFVTKNDGIALVLSYGGVAQANIIPNFYGVLTCQVVGIAFGGGNPNPTLKANIEQLLVDRSVLESISVVFDDAAITSVDVTASAKMLAGYTYTGEVDKYFDLAWRLFLSETGREIQDDCHSNGIESATTLINNIFTKTFVPSDYAQIGKLIEGLTPADFGASIQLSDIFSYIQSNVIGVDYMLIGSIGGGIPTTLAESEITTVGTLTLSEIP